MGRDLPVILDFGRVTLMNKCVGIIGVGNMGEALLAGLIKAGHPAGDICITDKRADDSAALASKYGVVDQKLSLIAAEC